MPRYSRRFLISVLEGVYEKYHRLEYVHPDPIEFVHRYECPRDQEVAGLIAASLAYGRVAQILHNVERILTPMGGSPRQFLETAPTRDLRLLSRDFQHRWTTGEEMRDFLSAIQRCLHKYGSIEACFASHSTRSETNVLPALSGFVAELSTLGAGTTSLLSSPAKGSACKRLFMYLRWMVRADTIDPGCWFSVSPAHLIMPVDTHIHRVALGLGLTRRKQANLATALEITARFRKISPDDPLKYDFALARLGIRSELDMANFLRDCRKRVA